SLRDGLAGELRPQWISLMEGAECCRHPLSELLDDAGMQGNLPGRGDGNFDQQAALQQLCADLVRLFDPRQPREIPRSPAVSPREKQGRPAALHRIRGTEKLQLGERLFAGAAKAPGARLENAASSN